MISNVIKRLAGLVLGLALVSIVWSPLSAQQDAGSAQDSGSAGLSIKRTVRRVILDVVVTDADGKPVHGLSQKDFSVTEDRNPQQIMSFDVHELETAPEFVKVPPLPPNTFVNAPNSPERGPLYVLLLDLVNTETTDEPWARQQLLKFISDKPQGTRFAVFVLSDTLFLAQGFTDDQKQLYAVLDPSHPRPHIPKIFLYQNNYGRGDVVKMINVFTYIGRFLDGLPGRKNLIWFSGSFPMNFFPEQDDVKSYKDEIKTALDTIAQAQIAIYPVDIRGVVVDNPHAPAGATGAGGVSSDDRTDASGNAGASAGASHAGGDQGYSLLANSYMVEDEIAKTTGGRAFYSTNDLKGALTEVTESGASYYTLTYSPSNQDYNGKPRNIRVELANRGYQLSYRRSYFGTDLDSIADQGKDRAPETATQTSTRKVGDSLYANMQHGAPIAHQLFFRAHIHAIGQPALATPEQMANLEDQPAYFRKRHKNRPAKPLPPIQLQTYAIDYTLATQARQGSSSHNVRPPAVEIAAAAFNADGRMLNGNVENTATDSSPNAPPVNPSGIYRAQQQIDVPVGAISIRIAVRDLSTDRVGAIEVALPLAPEPQAQSTSALVKQN